MRVNGLFGHVRRNDLASAVLFVGFLFAFQLIACVALFLPLSVFDAAHAPIYGWGGYAVRYVPLVGLAGALLFAANMWWHVQTVARALDLRYVDNADEPRLCRIVEPIAIAAGIATPYVAVIETPALNAFACGIRAGDMVVVVTRGLIDGLDDDELGAVVAHEIVHIARGDTRLMAAVNVLGRNLTILQSQNMLRVRDWRQVMLMVVIPVFFPLMLVSGFLTQLAFRAGHLSRLLISTAREYVADAEAVRLTHNPAALVRALHKIDGRSAVAGIASELDAMMIDGATTGALATHPTIAERVATLVRLTGSMALIAPTGRDTRTGGGFGRRVAGGAVIASEVSKRPTWSALLRVNQGSDRNIFGLDAKTTPLVLGVAAVLAVIHSDDLANPRAMAANFDLGPAQALVDMSARAIGCTVGHLTGTGERLCDQKKVNVDAILHGSDHKFTEVSNVMGGGNFASIDDPDPAAVRIARDRCFISNLYSIGDRGFYAIHESSGDVSMTRYLGYIDNSLNRVTAATAAGRDDGLKRYVETRKITGEVTHRFFGRPGLDMARATLFGPAASGSGRRDRAADDRCALRAFANAGRSRGIHIADNRPG